MGRCGEESPTYDACPEAIAVGRTEAEIEDAELARGSRDLLNTTPSAGHKMQNGEEADHSTRDIDGHLHNVGPHNRGHAAFERVDQCQECNDRDRENVATLGRKPKTGKDPA